jgi:hypothetical protein
MSWTHTDTDAGGTSFIQLARAPIVIYSRLHSMLALAPRTSTHAQCSVRFLRQTATRAASVRSSTMWRA